MELKTELLPETAADVRATPPAPPAPTVTVYERVKFKVDVPVSKPPAPPPPPVEAIPELASLPPPPPPATTR
jgi:hypothetical protein